MRKAFEILNNIFGYKEFRKGQQEVIEKILSGMDVFCILPTGGGKSLCYEIPAYILSGVTLVVSPLISLMKDQVDNLNSLGIKAAYISGGNDFEEVKRIMGSFIKGEIKLLYVSPERLENKYFLENIEKANIIQVVVDEAHCVSMWGHDFRKSYSKIKPFINKLRKRPIVTAFTATATEMVMKDSIELLGLKDPFVYKGSFTRDNLEINILKEVDKLESISEIISEHEEESGIIYCSTKNEVEELYKNMIYRGKSVGKYHGSLKNKEKNYYQEEFLNDNFKVMIATNAFGMGIDKPDVKFIIHSTFPKSIENYYQEIGRGGRDGSLAKCYLLYSEQDIRLMDYLISSTTEISRRTIELKKLEQIIEFCNFDKCLRKYILDYFGEENSIKYCNNCTNCLKNNDFVDMTLEAQKILSCIYRTKEAFGESVLIDILRGVHGPKIEKYKLYELSTFGIMKEYTNKYIKDIINELLAISALERKEGTYSMLKLNRRSIGILKGEEKVFLDINKNEESVCKDLELFKRLRILRKDISRREGIKPYIVFTDSMIMDIINKNPKSKEALKNIRGFGEQKITKYGSFIITTLKDYEKYKKRN
ncbi:DNA helicase RecQ [Clostridium sp. LIBA-8841]|uniref:DNA helicase RecQ n=1 Tax=Clostridium sp. LIBA-8841 TaxID=2987530 RepID=UPI002AC4ABCF|nr:DNA helicase RecQ [Clostridium sp. LIBA-8841]MDZ5252231.1 DNA helicase RecQ [Clostridium sp. LIBA-8841]